VRVETPTGTVTLEALTGVVIELTAGSVDTPTGADTLEAVTGVAMLDTPTPAGGLTLVAISKATELTTAVEKNTAPVSKNRVSAPTVMFDTVTGVAVETGTVTADTLTGMEMEDTPTWAPTVALTLSAISWTTEPSTLVE
jgi:hypothetical protein